MLAAWASNLGVMALHHALLCLAGSDTLYVLYHDSFPVIRQLDVGNEVAFRTVQQLVLQCMAVGEQVFVGFG